MIKRITPFRTKPEVTTEQLRAWWIRHTDIVRQKKGMRGYVTNRILEEVGTSSGLKGIAEFWFETRQDHDWGYDPSNPLSQQASQDSRANGLISYSSFVVEERVAVPPPHKGDGFQSGVKRIVLFKAKPGITREGLREWWAKHTALARQMRGLTGCVTNLVLEEQRGDTGVQGVAELWFDSRASMDRAYDPGNPLRQKLAADHEPVSMVIATLVVEERLVVPPPRTR